MSPRRLRWSVALGATVLLVGLIAANARFVQLAFEYRAECVPHARTGDGGETAHRAARSSC